MSPAPECSRKEGERGRPASEPPADVTGRLSTPGDVRCRRCRKPIRDLEVELYFLQTGLCFWCAYVDSQG